MHLELNILEKIIIDVVKNYNLTIDTVMFTEDLSPEITSRYLEQVNISPLYQEAFEQMIHGLTVASKIISARVSLKAIEGLQKIHGCIGSIDYDINTSTQIVSLKFDRLTLLLKSHQFTVSLLGLASNIFIHQAIDQYQSITTGQMQLILDKIESVERLASSGESREELSLTRPHHRRSHSFGSS